MLMFSDTCLAGLFARRRRERPVERHWGRIGSVDQSKTFWFDDETDADKMARLVSDAKSRRGYVAAPSPTSVNTP